MTADKLYSQKYRMTMFGLGAVMLVFLSVSAAVILKPSVSATLVGFAQTVVASFGAMIAVFAASQAAVDFKTASTPPAPPSNVIPPSSTPAA